MPDRLGAQSLVVEARAGRLPLKVKAVLLRLDLDPPFSPLQGHPNQVGVVPVHNLELVGVLSEDVLIRNFS